jgi:exopolysaccharide/PEP-CTERM locus tyrosine autokinase
MSVLERALAKAKLAGDQSARAARPPQLGRVREPAPAPGGDASPVSPVEVKPSKHIEIDRAALRQAGLLAPESQEWRILEEYRQIKRPLLAKAAGRAGLPIPRANLVAVTSAVPGEGKTFTCINMSISIAREKDWRVLLVDADVAKPHVTSLFGLGDEPGLLDCLRDPSLTIEQCTIATDIPGLSILPAGRRDDYTDELLASERMELVIQRLAGADPRRLVMFDTSPLLATTQAAVVAAHVAQIVVVVKAGSTTHEQARHAIGKLDPEKAIGLVLNQAQLGADRLAYGGQYGYGSDFPDRPQAGAAHDTPPHG